MRLPKLQAPKINKIMSKSVSNSVMLTLKAPTPQNGQTHSNNSSATADKLFEWVWPFCGVGAERVNGKINQNISQGSQTILRRCYVKSFLKIFAKFTRKHLYWSLFLIKLQVKVCNFIKETLAWLFSCEFCEIFRNNYFPQYRRTAASERFMNICLTLELS